MREHRSRRIRVPGGGDVAAGNRHAARSGGGQGIAFVAVVILLMSGCTGPVNPDRAISTDGSPRVPQIVIGTLRVQAPLGSPGPSWLHLGAPGNNDDRGRLSVGLSLRGPATGGRDYLVALLNYAHNAAGDLKGLSSPANVLGAVDRDLRCGAVACQQVRVGQSWGFPANTAPAYLQDSMISVMCKALVGPPTTILPTPITVAVPAAALVGPEGVLMPHAPVPLGLAGRCPDSLSGEAGGSHPTVTAVLPSTTISGGGDRSAPGLFLCDGAVYVRGEPDSFVGTADVVCSAPVTRTSQQWVWRRLSAAGNPVGLPLPARTLMDSPPPNRLATLTAMIAKTGVEFAGIVLEQNIDKWLEEDFGGLCPWCWVSISDHPRVPGRPLLVEYCFTAIPKDLPTEQLSECLPDLAH